MANELAPNQAGTVKSINLRHVVVYMLFSADLADFAAQWVYCDGYPSLEVDFHFHRRKQVSQFTIKQVFLHWTKPRSILNPFVAESTRERRRLYAFHRILKG
jgi:hypothetical protein